MHPPTARGARFGHVNVIASDWRRLAGFYTSVFGCELVPPERDYGGEILERGTAVPGATLRGAHLRLPGHGDAGPTIEIYTYGANEPPAAPPAANREGWGHVAFAVDDVDEARDAAIGFDGTGRLLYVVHIEYDGPRIRIISARRAEPDEERRYAK